MKTVRKFCPADRYVYDFRVCTPSKGFAQVDTGQDASYFGTWANPEKLVIVCYCEGDVTTELAETPEEFVAAMRNLKKWNEDNGHRFIGVDPMGVEAIKARFITLGLAEMLH